MSEVSRIRINTNELAEMQKRIIIYGNAFMRITAIDGDVASVKLMSREESEKIAARAAPESNSE